MVDTMLLIIGAVLVLGIFPCLPQSKEFFSKSGLTDTRRSLLGLCIFTFGGMIASVWTIIIKNDLEATGATQSCTSAGCSALIGDYNWNTMPIIGIEWGLMGLLAFTALGFIALSAFLDESNSSWVYSWINAGTIISGAGLVPVAWLVSVELFLHEDAVIICPFCTLAHIAAVLTFILFFILRKRHDNGSWNT